MEFVKGGPPMHVFSCMQAALLTCFHGHPHFYVAFVMYLGCRRLHCLPASTTRLPRVLCLFFVYVVQTGHRSHATWGLRQYPEHKRVATAGEETGCTTLHVSTVCSFYFFALAWKRVWGQCPLWWCLLLFSALHIPLLAPRAHP